MKDSIEYQELLRLKEESDQRRTFVENENNELKAKLELLSKVDEVTEEVTELSEEPKPISFNPENTNQVEPYRFAKNKQRSTIDSIFEKLNK